jgi:hypothetical protein
MIGADDTPAGRKGPASETNDGDAAEAQNV